MKTLNSFFVAALVLLACTAPCSGVEPPAGKVMIVLDASGSMWAEIDGEYKIVIARRVIHDLLRDWDPGLELGLTVYGHRRKGDCTDIEVLVPVGRDTQKAILDAVDRLMPRGKTPLSAAVRMAAESLKYTEDRVTVILVSDGKETCGADPCAIGKALEETGIDFTAHVIGFDVTEEEESDLACLAQNTGGTYITARDAGSLKIAFEKTVTEVKKKAAEPVPAVEPKPEIKPEPETKPEPKPAPAPEPKPEPASEPAAPPVPEQPKQEEGVRLVALYKEGGPEFKGDITWYVFEAGVDADGKGNQVAHQHRGRSGHVFRDLPAGTYVVVAELTDARYIRRELEIQVAEGEAVTHDLVLDIGTVRFDARLAEGAEPFQGGLGWKVHDTKTDLAGNRREITEFWRVHSGSVFLLPAGQWLISGVIADAKYIGVKKEISVQPGGEEAHDFVFNAGTVRFDARLAEGAEPFKGGLGWKVHETKTDLSGNRREITEFWRVHSGSVFLLPAGRWLISGVIADAKYIGVKKEIIVQPGGEEAHDFVFNAGTVRFDARIAEGAEPFKGGLGWWVYHPKADLSGNRRELANFWRVDSGSVYLLPAGAWLVRGGLADFKHVGAEKEMVLNPGEEQALDMVFNAGQVTFVVTLDGASYDGQTAWEVFQAKADFSGNRPSITSAWRVPSGSATYLPAGEYLVQASQPDHKEIRGETVFKVSAGGETAVSVDMKTP